MWGEEAQQGRPRGYGRAGAQEVKWGDRENIIRSSVICTSTEGHTGRVRGQMVWIWVNSDPIWVIQYS